MFSQIAIILGLVLLNGFFAMSELAIVSARRARLKQLAEQKGGTGAEIALKLASDPVSFLSIVQIGMTVISVFMGAYSAASFAHYYAAALNQISWIAPYGDAVSLGLIVVVVTYLNLVIGELFPKRIGLAYAEHIAIHIAGFMQFMVRLTAPLIWVLRQSTELIMWLTGLSHKTDNRVTEDEVRGMIAEGAEHGIFKPAEKDMLESVMRLANRSVRTIMTPRPDMIWLDVKQSRQDYKTMMSQSGYSRFPVMRNDGTEIVGIIHAKDLLNATFENRPLDIQTMVRAPLVVLDTMPVLKLLEQFKRSGQHIAIVADEYGSLEGMVTVTDIIEAITGELPDQEQAQNLKTEQQENGTILMDGMVPLDEVEELLGVRNMRGDGDFYTLAGFMVDRLGRLPVEQDHFDWQGIGFRVMAVAGRRIAQVQITPPHKEDKVV